MNLHHSFYVIYSRYLFDNFECYNACVLNQSADKHFRALCQFAEVEDNLKILDVGCGGGKFLNFVFNNFDNVKSTGIDFSQRQITMAQKNSVGPIYQCFDFNSFSLFLNSIIPSLLFDRFNSLSEQSMPLDSTPLILAIFNSNFVLGITAPGGA